MRELLEFFKYKQKPLVSRKLEISGFALVVPKTTPGLAGGIKIASSEEYRRQEKSSPL